MFRGAVLEGVNGKSLDKRLEQDASFCDVDFLTNMLQQVRLGACHAAGDCASGTAEFGCVQVLRVPECSVGNSR